MGRRQEQSNGTRQTNGPNSQAVGDLEGRERFSHDGENASNAQTENSVTFQDELQRQWKAKWSMTEEKENPVQKSTEQTGMGDSYVIEEQGNINEQGYSGKGLQEWEVISAVYEALDRKRGRNEGLIRIGGMPKVLSDIIGSDADIYVRANHLYENIVDREQAEKDGRYRKNAHYHNLGAEMAIDAIMSLENPALLLAESGNENPTVVAVLPMQAEENAVYAALSFYSNEPINGDYSRRPHIVLTISPIAIEKGSNGRQNLVDTINRAIDNEAIIYFDKKMTAALPVNAQNINLGIVTDASVKNSLAKFKKNVNRFRENNGIRYSMDDGGVDADEDFAAVAAQLNAQNRQWEEMWLKDQLGEDGYRQFREYRKQQEASGKKANADRAKVKQTAQRNARAARKESAEARADASAQKRMADAQVPSIAKRDFRRTVLELFSVPVGQRNELGAVIEHYADRLLKNGTLTEEDRQRFFDRMYESGAMTVPAEENYAEARSYIRGGRIYVPDSVVVELGDDWGDIRRRAFAAGVILTRDRSQAGTAGGIDAWNAELAGVLPGLFDSVQNGPADRREYPGRCVSHCPESYAESPAGYRMFRFALDRCIRQ